MQLTEEHKKIIAEQKKQCPFCKIVKGEIPSKVLFKDEKIIALLDINPITKGHVLLMPKEHYPIMPFIPEATRKHLFRAAVNLSQILKTTFLQSGTTIFIANGAAAGQQSTHFLMHLFPREETLQSSLNLTKIKSLEHYEEHFALLKQILQQRLKPLQEEFPLQEISHTTDTLEDSEASRSEKTIPKDSYEHSSSTSSHSSADLPSSESSKDLHTAFVREVLRIVHANPELKQLILSEPELVKKSIPHHPQLAQIFKRVSFDEIYALLKKEQKTLDQENDKSDKGNSEKGKQQQSTTREEDEKENHNVKKSAKLSQLPQFNASSSSLPPDSLEQSSSSKKKPDLDKISQLFK